MKRTFCFFILIFTVCFVCEKRPALAADIPPCLTIHPDPILPEPAPLENDDGEVAHRVARGVVIKSAIWKHSETVANETDSTLILRVRFLGGTDDEMTLVRQVAPEWSKYADVRFEFVESDPSDIRVGFDPGGGNWSSLGKFAIGKNKTMNLALRGMRESRKQGVILHEFGHALGLHHEHKSPTLPFEWNEDVIIEEIMRVWKWTKDRIRLNILDKLSETQTNFTEFDPHSIMIYPIPNRWTIGDFEIDYATVLSEMDKQFIGEIYGVARPLNGRSPRVRDAIVAAVPGVNNAADVTAVDLAQIKTLIVNDIGDSFDGTYLKSDDFDGLTNLTRLELRYKYGYWAVYLLPKGIFEGLTSLKTLVSASNRRFLVALRKVGTDQFKAVAPAGAPFDIVLPLVVANGTINGGATSITIPKGSVESTPLTVTRTPGSKSAVYVDIEQFPSLPDGHEGYFFVRESADLSFILKIFDALPGAPTPIHKRTPQVIEAIVKAVPEIETPDLGKKWIVYLAPFTYEDTITYNHYGALISDAQLEAITSLDLSNAKLRELKPEDFEGLTNLTKLNLSFNKLSSLPRGIFDKLTNLTVLELGANELSSLIPTVLGIPDIPIFRKPSDIFDELTNLKTLELAGNELSSLPSGVLDELTNLTRLDLGGNNLSSLPSGIFGELTNLTSLSIGGNELSSLQSDIFDELTNLTGLELDYNELSSLQSDIFDELTTLTSLNLEGNKFGSLPAGIFDNTTNLIGLQLSENQLSTLPVGIFDNTTNLIILALGGNQLNALPASIFSQLTNLIVLDLTDNQLSTLPAGIFEGLSNIDAQAVLAALNTGLDNPLDSLPQELSSLTILLSGNPVDPLPLTVSLEKIRIDGFKAVVPTGAPFDIVLPITVTNGSISGGATSLTIPKGSLQSEALTVTRAAGTTATVTVDIGNPLQGLPDRHSGYALVKSGTLPLTFVQLDRSVFTPVSDRTPEVRDAIVKTVPGIDSATDVTAAHLAAITSMSIELSNSIKIGDFDGLTGLTSLGLTTEELTSLPAGLFKDLSNVTYMEWYSEKLSTLPVGTFEGLTNLETFGWGARGLTSLPAGVFAPLTDLTTFEIAAPQLNKLPANMFDRLTNLTYLSLYAGRLRILPDSIFDQLTQLKTLTLASDQLTSLPDGIFDRLTQLTSLRISRTQLTNLPDGLFSGLSSLTSLRLDGNAVDPLPFTVSLEKVGAGQFKAVASTGAPFDLILPINVTNGSINSGITTLTIPTGSVESGILTVSHTPNAIEAVAVDIGTLPGLPTTVRNGTRLHTGYTLTKSIDLPLEFGELGGRVFTPVSERTPQVRDKIVEAVPGVNSAADITKAHLAAITGLGLGLNPLVAFGGTAGEEITSLQTGDFDGLTGMTTLWIGGGEQLRNVPAGIFKELTALETLNLTGNFSSLPNGVFDGLTALTFLSVASLPLESLPAGVFDDLTALTTLIVWSARLESLPAGVFDQLTALTKLAVSGPFDSLPADIFSKLTSLTLLGLGVDETLTLPAGTFEGLTTLTDLSIARADYSQVDLQNPESLDNIVVDEPLPLIVSLEKVGTDQFKTVAPTGAPFEMVLPLTVTNGSINGVTRTTITIPAGSVESNTLMVKRIRGTTAAVTLNIGTLPELPTDHEGYTLVKSDDLPLEFTTGLETEIMPVRQRTPQVRDAIIRAARVNSAADVTDAHLAAITQLNLISKNITSLKSGDFDGLTAMTWLRLNGNPLTSLPAGVFSGLSSLTTLSLHDTYKLTSLPADVFSRLSSLTTLELNNNKLASLPEDVFSGLTSLESLWLSSNALTDLPKDVFKGLTSLTTLYLTHNDLTGLRADVFSGLTSLTTLWLYNNKLTSLPKGAFSGLTSLESLKVSYNRLTNLPDNIFEGLTSLTTLSLSGNAVDPFSFTVSLKKVGPDQFKAVAPAGAPFAIVLPLTVTNGSITGGATSITIPVGSLESGALTVTRTAGTTAAVRVNIGTLPGLPTNHTGYTLVKSAGLPLEIITGTNNVPVFTDGTSTTRTIAENTAANTNIGTPITATDTDSGDTLTYTLSGTDAASFGIVSTTGQLQTKAALDYETKTSYTVTVSVSDGNGGSDSITVTINVTDVNETIIDPPLSERTSQVRDAIVREAGVNSADDVTEADLVGIWQLDLESKSITALKVGDFNGLTSLRTLSIRDNQLTTLPADIFDGLTALTTLNLEDNQLSTLPVDILADLTELLYLTLADNQLTTLPAGIFEGPSALRDLWLDGNRFTTLPVGIFKSESVASGFNSLRRLYLEDNTVDPLPLTLSLEKVADGQFKAVAPTGAAFKMVLPISVTNGSINGGATTLTIPKGHVESETLTVTRTAGTTAAVTVDLGTLPSLPQSHEGYVLRKSVDLPLKIISGTNTAPVFTDGTSTTRSIAENTAANTNIGTAIAATDADSGNTLTYTLSGTDAASFAIVSTSGQLQTKAALDYETKNSYSITISVSDGNGGSDSITVTINVTDINENRAPIFADGASTTRTIAENTAVNTNIGTAVSATDADTGDTLTYTLAGTDAASFSIVSTTGQLQTNAALDYETKTAYSVTVSVSDGNGGSDSITVTINITDVNENAAPVFADGTSITRTIAENTASGENIGTAITATDADNDTLTYTLSGTDAAAFSIVSTTGQLQTSAALDYETKTAYSVTITVSDGNLTATITVTINVTDIDETTVEAGEITTVPGICRVGDVLAPGESCTYPGTDTEFSVNNSGIGQFLFFTAGNNLNIKNTELNDVSYTLVAKKLASGSWEIEQIGTSTAAQTVNTAPMFTDGTSTTRTVAENTAASTNIGTAIAATDADTGDTLTYTLSGTDAASFSIVSTTGQLQTNAGLDYETKASYAVTVSVSDGNGGSGSIDVTINITDANDAPVFSQGNTITVTTVLAPKGNTEGDYDIGDPLFATDADGDSVTYSLSGTDANLFNTYRFGKTVNGQIQSHVQLTTRGWSLHDANKSSFTVIVTASDRNGGSDSITVTINVVAETANNAPVFTDGTSTTRIVAENTAANTNIGAAIAATDADTGDTLTYTLGGTDVASFSIVSTSGQLQTKAALDYETKTTYTVTISVSDGNGGTDSITVTINVTDVNENSAPAFTEGTTTTRTVAENIDADTTVTAAATAADTKTTTSAASVNIGSAVSATDADNDTLTYTLSGRDAAAFTIDSTTGQLKAKAALDYETKSTYTVTVSVSDGSLSDTITVTINVTDLNELSTTPAICQVGDVIAPGESCTYPGTDTEFSVNNSGIGQFLFFTAGNNLNIKNTKLNGVSYTLVAKKLASGSWEIEEVADKAIARPNTAPVFTDGTSTTRSVAENTAANTNIGTAIAATDTDTADTLTYTLSGTDAASFGIVSTTGQLQTRAALDYETKPSYSVTVSVSDGNGGSDSITVTINVTNVNEIPANNAPVFTEGTSTTRSVAENTGSGVTISTAVSATDADNDILTYSLSGTDAASFGIVSTTGQLQTNAALDYETKNTYRVTVSVSDGTLTDTISVTINVIDVNDTVITLGVVSVANRTPEVRDAIVAAVPNVNNAASVTAAHLAAITGLNLRNAGITALKIGDFSGMTALTSINLFNNQLSSLPPSIFAGLTSLTTIRLGRNTIDPFPLIVSLEKVGDGVFKAVAPAGATFNYVLPITVTNGTINGGVTTLTIPHGNMESGTLTLTRTPGTTGHVMVDIGAFPGLPRTHYGYALTKSDYLPLAVIRGINTAPVFSDGTTVTRSIAENTAPNTNIGTPITATDVDNDRLTYTLSGTHAAAFGIDSTTGQLRTQAALDYETKTSYAVTVAVSDGYGGSNRISVTINVTDIRENRAPVFTDGTATTRTVAENTATNTNIGTAIAATDADNDTLTYTLRGTDAAAFRIVNTTGQLRTRAALDYETKTSYAVTISVSDGNGGIDSITVTINVTDVNENRAPVFTDGTSTTRAVAENTATNTNIGTAITATDADGDTLTYTLSGTDAAAFGINSTTGQLRTKAALDYETKTSYAVIVSVSDGSLTDTITVTINITDLDDTRVVSGVTPVSQRTPQVRDAIVAAVPGVNSAANVTEAHLARITTLNLRAKRISALKAGDFDGLSALREIELAENQLRTLPTDIFSGLSSLRYLYLNQNQLTLLPEKLFDGLTSLEHLYLNQNQLIRLPEKIFNGLVSIRQINLHTNKLTRLPPKVFSGLPALLEIFLRNNQLTEIPADVFSGLPLIHLYLDRNRLTDLPADVFSGLSSLTSLLLNNNQMSTLPTGVFRGLTASTRLWLHGNTVDPLPLIVSLEKVGTNQFKAVVPAGAPFRITLPLSVANGSISSGATTLTIPQGSVESGTLAVTRTVGTTAAVTVDIGTLPRLPANHQGYKPTKSTNLPRTIISSPGNRAPMFTEGTNTTRTIAENTARGIHIGPAVTATDADNDTLTYSLGGTDAATFGIDATTGQLKTEAALDYETKTTYTVTVTVSDGSLTDTITVTINITDVAELPTTTAICRVGDVLAPGESCTYPDTDAVFSVRDDGSAQWNIPNFPWLNQVALGGSMSFTADINNENYHFVAKEVSNNSWEIEEIGDDTKQQPETPEQPGDTGGILTLRASTAAPLTEAILHEGIVTLTLSGGTYERSNWRIRDAVSVSGITGIALDTFDTERISDTKITVKLEFDGNINTDTTLTITVKKGAIVDYDGAALTAQIPVTAASESISASTAAPLTEATLDESVITLTLSGRKFERRNSTIRGAVSVSGISGITVRRSDIDRQSDTEVTVELTFNGNLNADSTLTLTVGADAIAGYNGPALMAQVSVAAGTEAPVEPETPEVPEQPVETQTPIESDYDYIEGPWLWMIAPGGDIDIDNLSEASEGVITEAQIAQTGVNEGDHFNDLQWTSGRLLPTTVCGIFLCSSDNVINVVREIGLTDNVQLSYYSAYALINIFSPRAQNNVLMGVGSDDSIKVWLNGSVAYENDVSRRTTGIQNQFPVNLNAGNNLLLIKVCNHAGLGFNNDWGMFFKLYLDTQDYTLSLPTGSTGGQQPQTPQQPQQPVNTGGTPTLSVSTVVPLTEATLHGGVITLNLSSGIFESSSFRIRNAVSVSGINGATVDTFSVDRVGDTKYTVELEYDGNMTANGTLTVSVGAGAIKDYNGASLTSQIAIPAVTESVTASTAAPLTEATLDESIITLTLNGRKFERRNSTIRRAVSVSGISGVTVRSSDIDRQNDTEVTVELTFNGNLNADSTLTLTVGPDAIAGYNGPELTAQVSVSAGDTPKDTGGQNPQTPQQPGNQGTPQQPVNTGGTTLSVSTATPLTEAMLHGGVITLNLSGATFERSMFWIRNAISVSGITGVDVESFGGERISDTQATIELEYEGNMTANGTLTISLEADGIKDYDGATLTAQIQVTTVSKSVAASTASPLTEATLDESIVTLTLTGAKYENFIFDIRGNVTVSGITGVTIPWNQPKRKSDTEITIELEFDGDMTRDGTLTFTVDADAIAGYNGPALTDQVTVSASTDAPADTANQNPAPPETPQQPGNQDPPQQPGNTGGTPTLTTSTSSPLTEATLHESVVTLTLSGGTYERSRWDIEDAVFVSGISGVTFDNFFGLKRVSDTKITVELEFAGNMDTNGTLTFTVGADAIAGYSGTALTAQVTVTAMAESVAASSTSPLKEANLDGSTVTLTLSGRKFERFIFDIQDAVSVSGIAGVTIPWHQPKRKSDTEITIELEFDGDMTTDGTLTFTVGADAIAGYNGAALTAQITVTADRENALLANFPNPFNPETWIPYHLAEPAEVNITIYAINGQVVRRLELEHQPAGTYQTRSRAAYWDGKNAFGEPVASGVYFYTLTAGDFTATRKMLIRK